MNLSQLANFVCSKVRHSDAASVALCKTYLTARFQMIWDSELWRDSLVLLTTTLDPTNSSLNNGLDALGIWQLPAIANKLVALRDHDRAYQAASPEEYFKIDLDEFGTSGTAVSFYILPSCCLALGANTALCVAATALADNTSTVHVRGLDASGNLMDQDVSAILPTPNRFTLSTFASLIEVTSITKQATAGVVNLGTLINGQCNPLLTLQPADTNAPQRCRIQLVEIPVQPVNLRALVKRTIPPFVNDQDVPQLRNIENVLIAFAQADMLQQTRQYAKAQLLQQEGAALLLDIKKEEVYQQAAIPRIIPNCEPPSTACSGGGFQWKGYW